MMDTITTRILENGNLEITIPIALRRIADASKAKRIV